MRTLIDELLSCSNEHDIEKELIGIKRSPPNYYQMKEKYPFGNPGQVKLLIGGQVNRNLIDDTCVVRISRALNYTEQPIPSNFRGLLTVKGGDGMNYALRVSEFKQYLLSTYGQPNVIHYNPNRSGLPPQSFRSKKGIILFENYHVTLWDGNKCINNNDCYWSFVNKVYLWVSSELWNPFV